ncbi:MAG TPA: hypothetical protein IAC04_05310 [Candidatus Coprenecus stercoravium]|uniref:DNA mismatch repair proteins mutS family domain-containing protein n=1 Tax=Candidatus Coprenecus stercoravium TaxID=2840735 RepID=A0A9D2GQU2_9BACT|nr:hypothetical protein [Candidatus Coprenecus stercoravium]
MIEKLPVSSGYALRCLMEQDAMVSKDGIRAAYTRLREFLPLVSDGNLVSMLHSSLCTLKNISHTLGRIGASESVDDIELFEVKHLLLLSRRTASLLTEAGFGNLAPDISGTEEALSILDPDGTEIASFYVYDSYSEQLAVIRQQLHRESDPERKERLMLQEQEEEQRIRDSICDRLRPYVRAAAGLMAGLADIDIFLAKALQYVNMGLCMPEISDGITSYNGLFNPYIKEILNKGGKDFTPIDITFGDKAVVIIGANMGGKTVVLKTTALCQYLFAFGMGIPAVSARIAPRERTFFISGDAQDMAAGLSSFAAEMTAIDEVVRCSAHSGSGIAAMIDEPARSTNPIEGTALVESLVRLLGHRGVALLLTTHYNISSGNCRRLRVTGMENGRMNYRLCPAPDGDVPHEALNVAESLNISPEWIGEAKKLLKYE